MNSNVSDVISPVITIEIPKVHIELIAREVYEKMMAQTPVTGGSDAEKLRQTLNHLMAKKFITINELLVLLGCSRGYIDKLIEEAHELRTEQPIPYCNLSGLIVFEPEAVVNWARTAKPLKRKQKRQGGKKTRCAVPQQ